MSHLNKFTETRSLESFMANPQEKFSQIYDQYIEKIYRFVFFKVNSQEIAEDLTSEVFTRSWETFKNGQKIENPQAFLYQVARNLIVDFYREKGKSRVISVESISINDPRIDLEEKALLSSDIEEVKQALVNLKDDYQDVIIWHYLDDLPIPEIAKILNKSEEATRVMLHRALKTLKNELNRV